MGGHGEVHFRVHEVFSGGLVGWKVRPWTCLYNRFKADSEEQGT